MINCPKCASTHIDDRHLGRKVGARIGTAAGAASGAAGGVAGALRGAQVGSAVGVLAGPQGSVLGGRVSRILCKRPIGRKLLHFKGIA